MTKAFFEDLARDLVVVAAGGDLPRRYLNVCRRQRILEDGLREHRFRARSDTELSQIDFHPPLSVVGESSDVIVRAEGLARLGLPIAFELDVKRRHRGTPLSDVLEMLLASTGRVWRATEALEEYRRFMGLEPSSGKSKYRKIPSVIGQVRYEIDCLEGRLREYVRKLDARTFACTVTSESLCDALSQVAVDKVVIGYCGSPGTPMVLNARHPVIVAWGSGSGLAVVRREDLDALLGQSGDLVSMDFRPDGWEGHTSSAASMVQDVMKMKTAGARRFEYYRSPCDHSET